jgi:glycosyltransferase involved in cell wall biosynthesis
MDAGVPVFGRKGCSIHVQEVMRAFMKLGAEIDLFASRTGGDPPADLFPVRLHRFPTYPKLDASEREASALAANDELPDLLDQHGPFDLLYERYSLWSFAAIDWARERGIPSVLEVNAPLIEEQEEHRQLVKRAKAREVAGRVFTAAHAVIAVSREVASYVQTVANAQAHVHVIQNGVNANRFAATVRPAMPAPAGMFTIGFVGTLKPWHGLSVLVRAFEMLYRERPNTRLLIVGDGTARETLLEDLKSRDLDHAAFLTGAVDPAQIPALLASMDVGVAPYPNKPNFYFSPLKVYEYMAAGLPVIASRVGQLASLIQHGETGLLCEAGDAASLARAIAVFMDDECWRRKLSNAARTQVLQQHTWDAVVRRTLDVAGLGRAKANYAEVAC